MTSPLRYSGILFVLALVACGGPDAPDYQGGGAVTIDPKPQALEAPGWVEFADLSLHTDVEQGPPVEPYLRGIVLGGLFEPVGNVHGILSEAPKRRLVTRGWLDLRTRAFHPDASGRARLTPYVNGMQDTETRGFYPTSDVIFRSEAEPVMTPDSPDDASDPRAGS